MGKKNKKNKEKKEKVLYYDDGSTIADMSGVTESKIKIKKQDNNKYYKPVSTDREELKTFFDTFKMILIPTAIVLFVLLLLILSLC